MKYYIIAGRSKWRPSWQQPHQRVKKRLDEQAEIRCWGGDLMQSAGGFNCKHYKELAFMGFVEVVMNRERY